MIKSLPAKLEQLFFTRVSVVAQPSYQDLTDAEQAAQDFTAYQTSQLGAGPAPDDQTLYVVVHRFQMPETSDVRLPYAIDVEAIAHFRFNEDLQAEEMQRGAVFLGHGVLYPATREMISTITGRQPNGVLLIPLSSLLAAPVEVNEGERSLR